METKVLFEKLIAEIETAGQLAREYFYQEEAYDKKDDQSVVTEVDLKTEERIRAFVAAAFPNDTIVGEEGDDVVGDSGYVWYIDPIDGTENFVRKIPLFSITATRLGPGPEGSFAVVHNPVSRQTFASVMEQGVYENQTLSRGPSGVVGKRRAIHVISDGGYASWVKPAKHCLVQALGKEYGRSASFSSGLLELAYVAAGRLDGAVSLYNKPWDTAAGFYLNKAAGSKISFFQDEVWQEYTGAVKELYPIGEDVRYASVVSAPAIHDELCAFVGDPKRWAT